jgi:hypothetical protein
MYTLTDLPHDWQRDAAASALTTAQSVLVLVPAGSYARPVAEVAASGPVGDLINVRTAPSGRVYVTYARM